MPDVFLSRPARGVAVRDIQRRLAALGIDAGDDALGEFGEGTEAAIRRFQKLRGLRIDGVCGPQTWASLVEAGYKLGDRMLYLRMPMLRGDDVLELQRRLGGLGFDAGRVDGIFGVRTGAALVEFQRNAGLVTDGICGEDTIAALHRVDRIPGPVRTVASVREEAALRDAPTELVSRRLAVGETGGLGALADALGHHLTGEGARILVLHDPNESRQAAAANEFGAEAFVGLAALDSGPCRTAFYEAEGFSSVGGARLAACALQELATVLPSTDSPLGMRLTLLRETRMPAIVCELGPPDGVVERLPRVVGALAKACSRWVAAPVA